jgi:Ohr subfamily peroxiredoxin
MAPVLHKTVYTAEAAVTGGREGVALTTDGQVRIDLAVPPALGGTGQGANPEQLFAITYAASFLSAIAMVAGGHGVDVDGASVTCRVGLGPTASPAWGIAARLDVVLPGVDDREARALAAAAHEICPYSNATRGNVHVEISLGGEFLADDMVWA